jgi:outer membrane protein assembly factor BamB
MNWTGRRGRRAGVALALASLLVLAVLPVPSSGADGENALQEPTPTFRAGFDRTGAVPGTAPLNNTTLWTHLTEDPVLSSPVVSQGRVYVGTMGGKVLCLNAYTGSRLWQFDTGRPVESSPTVVDGHVFVGSDDKHVYCLDARDGTLVWSTPTGGEVKGSPLVTEGRVLVGSNDFGMHCLDARDGHEVWNFSTGGWVFSSPAIADGSAFFGSCDGHMYCVDVTNGSQVWSFEAEYIPASPAVSGDVVIFGAYDDRVYYLDRSTGVELMNVTGMVSGVYSSAAVYEDVPEDWDLPAVFVPDNSGTMFGIDGDGESFLVLDLPGGITASPVLALDGPGDRPMLVYATDGGDLHGREVRIPGTAGWDDPSDPVAWSLHLGNAVQSSPFLYHGRVYVGASGDGGGGLVACVGEIGADEEWMEIRPWNTTNQVEGRVKVNIRVHGFEPDRVEVTFEGETIVASESYLWDPTDPFGFGTRPNFYSAVFFDPDPPEGFRNATARAYIGDELVMEETGEVLVLVEGWARVVVTIDEPREEFDLEGVQVVRGRASSNYSIVHVTATVVGTNLTIPVTGLEEWSFSIDGSDLEDGVYLMQVTAGDGYRGDSAVLFFTVGGGPSEEVKLIGSILVVLLLVLVFVLLLKTRPPRVPEGGSSR